MRLGQAVAARMLWVGWDTVRQEFAKARRGRDACGMFRQSRWRQDGYGRMGIEKVRQGEAVEEFNG